MPFLLKKKKRFKNHKSKFFWCGVKGEQRHGFGFSTKPEDHEVTKMG